MFCHCGQELFIAPVLIDDQPALMHSSGRLFHDGHCFESELTRDEVETLALFCSFERLHPEDVRLQAERFFDGRQFDKRDVRRILERMKEIGHQTQRLPANADEGDRL